MYNNVGSNLPSQVAVLPLSGACYDFFKENKHLRKTVWLVPHVIKHKEGSEVISWRCNWGHSCESDCIYAMSRMEKGPLPQ